MRRLPWYLHLGPVFVLCLAGQAVAQDAGAHLPTVQPTAGDWGSLAATLGLPVGALTWGAWVLRGITENGIRLRLTLSPEDKEWVKDVIEDATSKTRRS